MSESMPPRPVFSTEPAFAADAQIGTAQEEVKRVGDRVLSSIQKASALLDSLSDRPPPHPRKSAFSTSIPTEAVLDAYFSVDIENDGPVPGMHSMSSFALVYAGRYEHGEPLPTPGSDSPSFYRELKPISEEFDRETSAVSGLDRNVLKTEGSDPADAMRDAATWIASVAGDAKPVLVGYPLGFDWMWLTWYFLRFNGESPFGHSGGYDVKTAFAAKSGLPVSLCGRSKLPQELTPTREHTHNALDDALHQAECFANVANWNPKP
jgi:hypothetical protein